jgi:hypothetical protein
MYQCLAVYLRTRLVAGIPLSDPGQPVLQPTGVWAHIRGSRGLFEGILCKWAGYYHSGYAVLNTWSSLWLVSAE